MDYKDSKLMDGYQYLKECYKVQFHMEEEKTYIVLTVLNLYHYKVTLYHDFIQMIISKYLIIVKNILKIL